MYKIFDIVYATVDPISRLFGDWLADVTIPSIIIRLLLACLFGGIVTSASQSPNNLLIGSTVA